MSHSKNSGRVTDEELDALIRAAARSSARLLPTTIDDVLAYDAFSAQADAQSDAEWIAAPDAFERVLAAEDRSTAPDSNAAYEEKLARVAREGTGKLTDDVLERMRADKARAKKAK